MLWSVGWWVLCQSWLSWWLRYCLMGVYLEVWGILSSTPKYVHIVLSILFSVYNLTMANLGPKHIVVIAFLSMLFN